MARGGVAKRPETQFAKSGELSIAYQVVGDGPLDLIFVPGFVSHVELNWDYLFIGEPLERLAEFARVVVFDKRGSGLSDRSLGNGTLEDRMGDICAVMDAAGIERAAVAAVSNGAPLAAAFAAMYPERVSSLALAMAGCPGMRPPDPLLDTTLELVGEYWTTGLVANMLVQHAPDPDEAVAQLARFERYCCTPSVAVEILRRGSESDLRPFLEHIRAPTLIVNQRRDPIISPDEGAYLAEHIPDARQVVLDGDFHGSWRPTDYDELLRTVEEFLTGQTSSTVAAADRILSTVVFTDIVRSTDRLADVGDASWRKVLDRYDDVCVDEVSRHRGVMVKQTGDGMLAHFDRPGRAVTCAVAINDRVGSLGLQTRSGVHTGEVELRGSDLSGISVHIAARVMGTADVGQVRVSRTVKDLTIGADLDFVDCGEHELKGVPGSWPLYAVA
jgi:pimeloyl-ACP methyl ester carboxylesterase